MTKEFLSHIILKVKIPKFDFEINSFLIVFLWQIKSSSLRSTNQILQGIKVKCQIFNDTQELRKSNLKI